VKIEFLKPSDIDAFLEFEAIQNPESGRDGAPHYHVYSASEPFDPDGMGKISIRRWTISLTEKGWRRTWGVLDGDRVVGTLQLTGADLASSAHRVDLGMGLLKDYRRKGWGSRLLETAIAWARVQDGIDWIDLGVFHDNPGARLLYERFGFVVTGEVHDCFRIDGVSIGNVAMSLRVGAVKEGAVC